MNRRVSTVLNTRATVTLFIVDCANCGIIFGIPDDFDDRRREDGGSFYCPNGHTISYHESESTKQKKRPVCNYFATPGRTCPECGEGIDYHEDVRTCRVCGCTDDDCSGCVDRTGEPCFWVESDLCSACQGVEASEEVAI